jgi:hypothetical protein
MTMRRNDDRWAHDYDLDRVRATCGGIAGGWLVVTVIAGLMLVVPPSVCVAEVALDHAKEKVAKAETRLAQVLPRVLPDRND